LTSGFKLIGGSTLCRERPQLHPENAIYLSELVIYTIAGVPLTGAGGAVGVPLQNNPFEINVLQ